MAPHVPLPDRLYQGRVQLLEVKYPPVPLFDLQSISHKAVISNQPHDMKVMEGDELLID